jgi:hypothetical protein
MRRFVLAASLLLAAGCDKKSEPPSPVSKAPPPFPALPEMKPAEDFLKDEFLELPAADPTAFGWNLAEGKIHLYSYGHESHMTRTTSSRTDSNRAQYRTRWKGAVKIVGGGERGSLFFLATPIEQLVNGTSAPPEELNKLERTTVEYQMTSAGILGSPRYEAGAEDAKLDLFFALPYRPLSPGEQDDRKVNLAHLVEKEQLQYHGRQEIRYAGRRKVGGHECVKLISKLDLEVVPKVPSAEGQGRLVGAIAAYFDPKEKRIVHIEVSLAMAVDVRYEIRPADLKVEPYWLMNRLQGDLRATIRLDD